MTVLKKLKQFFIKYNLFDFKTRNHKLSVLAMIANFGAATFKIIAAFYISSYFLIVSSFYSFGIGLTTQLFFRGVKRTHVIPSKEEKYVILMYLTLLASSMVYTFYMARQFYIQVTAFNYGMFLSLAIAIVSFTELGIAIRGLIKSYHLRDSLLTARKVATLINALVALVVTQTAIMTFVLRDGSSNHKYNAILGTSMGAIAVLMSAYMLFKNWFSDHKPLEHMTLEELWELFPIFLVPHNNAWSRRFNREKKYLLSQMTYKVVKNIEHIGSTAIHGIHAKNIIDMLLIIEDSMNMKDIALSMKKLGYRIMSESSGRISLNKGYTRHGFARDVFHVHLRYEGDDDEVYFRDYLSAHPELAKAYETLKLNLADMYKNNRDAYTNAKSEFINNIMIKAKSADHSSH